MGWSSLYDLKPAFVGRLDFVVDQLAARQVSPNSVTMAAVPVVGLISISLALGRQRPSVWLAVPGLCLLLMAVNAIDGRLAISSGRTSPFGAVLNELVDRMADVAMIGAGFSLVSPDLAGVTLSLVLLAETVALVAWGGIGVRALVGIMGKPDRVFVISVGSVAGAFVGVEVFVPVFLTIALGAVITTIQRVCYVISRARSTVGEKAHAS